MYPSVKNRKSSKKSSVLLSLSDRQTSSKESGNSVNQLHGTHKQNYNHQNHIHQIHNRNSLGHHDLPIHLVPATPRREDSEPNFQNIGSDVKDRNENDGIHRQMSSQDKRDNVQRYLNSIASQQNRFSGHSSTDTNRRTPSPPMSMTSEVFSSSRNRKMHHHDSGSRRRSSRDRSKKSSRNNHLNINNNMENGQLSKKSRSSYNINRNDENERSMLQVPVAGNDSLYHGTRDHDYNENCMKMNRSCMNISSLGYSTQSKGIFDEREEASDNNNFRFMVV